jgi:hypothetical protein
MINCTEKNRLFCIDRVVQNTVPIWSRKYQKATPFSHIVIDNFLTSSFLKKVKEHFLKIEDASVTRKNITHYLKNGY